MKNVLLLYNPEAGSLGGNLRPIMDLEAHLKASDFSVDMQSTGRAGEAARLARAAVDAGYDALVVCGGDGTINEAIQEMVGSETVLAVYPCGTANVFARELGLTRNAKKVSQLLAAGDTRTISVGLAKRPETDWHRYFLLMAGIGIDAELVRSVSPQLKRSIGQGAYFAAGINYLMRWQLASFRLSVDGQVHRATYATIANAARYGGGFTIAPGARLDDDRLNVCLFNSESRFDYLGYAALALSGRHVGCEKVTYIEAAQVSAGSDGDVLVQLDGELAGSLPMQFSVVPAALRVAATRG